MRYVEGIVLKRVNKVVIFCFDWFETRMGFMPGVFNGVVKQNAIDEGTPRYI